MVLYLLKFHEEIRYNQGDMIDEESKTKFGNFEAITESEYENIESAELKDINNQSSQNEINNNDEKQKININK